MNKIKAELPKKTEALLRELRFTWIEDEGAYHDDSGWVLRIEPTNDPFFYDDDEDTGEAKYVFYLTNPNNSKTGGSVIADLSVKNIKWMFRFYQYDILPKLRLTRLKALLDE